MTRDEAIDIILMRCGRRESNEFFRQVCISEMALAQQTKLERADFKPWFLLSEMMRATTGIDESRLPLPPLFLEEHEEGTLWLKDPASGVWVPIVRGDEDQLQVAYEGVLGGPPERYSIVRGYFVLYPTPDIQYSLKMRCYLREPTLTAPYGTVPAATNSWLTEAPDWLIAETGAIVAGQHIKDRDTANEFAQQAKDARTSVYTQHVIREEMNRERSAGDD